MNSGNSPATASKQDAPPATLQQQQAKALNVTPGQGVCPDPDAEQFGAQKYLLWHNWLCEGLVRDPTSLWRSPREPLKEEGRWVDRFAPHLQAAPRGPNGEKRPPVKVMKQVQVADPETPGAKTGCRQWHVEPAGVLRTLNQAVRRQREYSMEDAEKQARERQAVAAV